VLSKTLGTIVVHVEGHRVDKVFVYYVCFDQRFFEFRLHPNGWLAYICPYSCCHVCQRVLQLSSSPHVAVPEEELCSLQSQSCESLLRCHGQKLVSEGLLFSVFNKLFHLVHFFVGVEILIASDSDLKVVDVCHVS